VHDGWEQIRELAVEPDPDLALGVFETVLVLGGRPVQWRRHRERLESSCRLLYGAGTGAGLDRRVAELAAGHREARLKVVAHPAGRGTVVVAESVAPLRPERTPGAPIIAPVRVCAGYGRHKLLDRGWLERVEASVPPGRRALLVTAGGAVLETTRANVFALRGGTLTTPPLDGAILPGVTRAMLLEQARECGIVTREERLTLDELEQADAVLLTGSLALVERAGHRPRGTTGEIAAALAAGVARVVRMGEDEYITQNAPAATDGR